MQLDINHSDSSHSPLNPKLIKLILPNSSLNNFCRKKTTRLKNHIQKYKYTTNSNYMCNLPNKLYKVIDTG